MSDKSLLAVLPIGKPQAARIVTESHYLHRRPPMSHAFGLRRGPDLVGVVTFGTPASRQTQLSVAPTAPNLVTELNRLWVAESEPRNTESWFVARALALLDPHIVVSYADTAHGHVGFIYRALNFRYAGWSDMERKSPRFDYETISGGHSRDAYRTGHTGRRIPRAPKVRYWTTTGTKRDRKRLDSLVAWPSLDWKTLPPPNAGAA